MSLNSSSLEREASSGVLAPAQGMLVEFKDLRFTVPIRGAKAAGVGRLEILKGITGACFPGRILAIMGASGAGKSTLLDILACNSTPGGKTKGELLVNGAPRNASAFRRTACYVMQRDVLLASATVREAITTSALLKLPMSLTYKEKISRVDRAIQVLNLTECQDVLIGDELLGLKGISGGQRRRVSIGIELVKEPTAIFLDEPTSGLDSEIASSLLGTLQKLARSGRTVALTIHQPNSLMVSKFDDFMLLAGGRLLFYGPWDAAVPFFAEAGLQCPQFTNPTDFFLHVIQEDANVETLAELQLRKKGTGGSPLPLEAAALVGDVEGGGGKSGKPSLEHLVSGKELVGKDSVIIPEVPWWYQSRILVARNFWNYMRNPLMLFAETAQYLFMGLFVGLMYLQLNNSVETGVQDRLASIWFGMAVLSFTPSYTAVTLWDRDRILLKREVGQAMYSVTSWFMARTAVIVPMQLLQCILFGIISFFMVGYTIQGNIILTYLAAYFLFQVTSESIGMLCAAVTKTSTSAILALTFLLLILLSFSGFLVSDIPVYFKWVKTISYLTYAYDSTSVIIFQNTDFVCTTGPPLCPQQGLVIAGNDLLPANVKNGLSPGENLLVLLGITVITRVSCWLAIVGAYKFHYL